MDGVPATEEVRSDASRSPTARAAPSDASAAFLMLALTLPAAVYLPITGNFFNADDFLHLYHIVNEPLGRFLLDMHGGHLLMTRNAVFLLCYELFGTAVAAYFWLVLLTHLLNVALLFQIIRDLTDSVRLACFGSALWGILPVHEGALGWYSVYGHVLAATFTCWVLHDLVRVARGRPIRRLTLLRWTLLLLAAATSFGVGIGTASVMPLVALLLLPASPARTRIVLVLAALAGALPFLYFGLQRLYVDLYGGLPSSLLLVAGLHYWPAHVEMFFDLLAYGILSVALGVFGGLLHYGGIAAGAGGAAYAVIVLAAFVCGPPILRRRLLAALALCVGAYAVVAAGRAMFGAGPSSGWGAQTPRFHYLGTAALTIATCLVLAEIARRWPVRPRATTVLLLAWAGASLIARAAVGTPIAHFDAARQETASVVAQIERAARSAPRAADVYIENGPFQSIGNLFIGSRADFPGWAAVFAIYFPTDVVAGRRIRFVEPDLYVIESAREGRRSAGLLVSPEDAPADVYRAGTSPP
jgi:hypothetical protein